VQCRAAEIRRESGVLKSSTADILEWDALGTGGGSFIEIDWNAEFVPDVLAGAMGDGGAIFQRSALEGNERDHVRGAHARMDSVVTPQINALHGGGDPAQGGFGYRLWCAGKSDHGAVMVGVHLRAQQHNIGDGTNGLPDRVESFGVAAFGKIRDALDQGVGHFTSDLSINTIPFFMTRSTRFIPK
jgi:hypothetical protein